MAENRPWYLDAVIYGIDVAKFCDGNGDGIGDFVGLTGKVPYLRDLGINCVWLLPFYPSPDRDNGYDVSDYYGINPKIGTHADFLDFLHKAGECGIRVLIDLVANHTSNEHPWFQAARRDEKSRFRDYYVWTDGPPPVDPDDKSIFPGQENSVWTYDDVARAYYFHKFYHFQPELNTANPAVLEEVLRVMDFWLALGVSGFRIDAAPLLIGDNGLPADDPADPHGVLKQLAEFARKRRSDSVLFGEVNLPLEQIRDYFGEDQLGLLLNFSVAGYIFGSLAERRAALIHEGLALLPQPPTNCGWANFLRNLDELDFSRLPDSLREVAFKTFAPRENMREFGRGIRRRVGPMLNGDPKRVELAFSIILSLPGATMFVYGDEIGMGDDLERKGRAAVRLPMQWSAGRNAGFSSAPIKDIPENPLSEGPYSYKRINVAAQESMDGSLLNQVRKLIRLRRTCDLFGKGRHVRLSADDPAIFAHAYETAGQYLVLLHNLSDHAVSAEVKLDATEPLALTDRLSGKRAKAEGSLRVEIEPFGYQWLETDAG